MTFGFRRTVHRVAFLAGLSSLLASRPCGMRVLMFHGIQPAEAQGFQEALGYLAGRFTIVPLARIVDQVMHRDAAPVSEMALTFDDGLLNNYSVAYPVLKRLGLPATFFLCPSLINKRAWLWNHEMRARLSTIKADRWQQLVSSLRCSAKNVGDCVEWMKTMGAGARAEAEAIVRHTTSGFSPTQAQREQYDVMGWSEVQALDPSIISIGSHSDTHPILTGLTDTELEREMLASRQTLEERLNRPIDTFCYPNGIYDERCLRVARRLYRAALTTTAGFVKAGDDPYQLARIPGTCDSSLLAWRLHRPEA